MQRDLVLQNGHVIDPLNQTNGRKDIYVKDGKIVADAGALVSPLYIDASDMIVTPGLIDFHAHVFPKVTEIGLEPDLYFIPQGVTTIVDPGSAGVSNVASFMDLVVNRSQAKIFALLNVCPTGLGTMKFHEDVNPKYWDEQAIRNAFAKWPEVLKGLKIRFSKGIVGETGIGYLAEAGKLARKLNTTLAVHTTDAPIHQDEVAAVLQKDDVFVHCFQGTGNTILDENNKVYEGIVNAQARGVLMDASNGGNHWSFRVAEQAIKEGFLPDVISTDLTVKTIFKDPVFSLPYILSKYLMLGLSLETLINTCTVAPATWLGQAEELGSLSVGTTADISLFKLEDKEIVFSDTQGEKRVGKQLLTPQMTIIDGEILYRNVSNV